MRHEVSKSFVREQIRRGPAEDRIQHSGGFMRVNKKKIVMTLAALGFLGVMAIPYRFFADSENNSFMEMVRFNETDIDNYCTGNIRNELLFGHYQIDNVNCHIKTSEYNGIRKQPSRIVSSRDIAHLYWLEDCEFGAGDGICKGPVVGDGTVPDNNGCKIFKPGSTSEYRDICNYRIYYKDSKGKWRDNLTGEYYKSSKK